MLSEANENNIAHAARLLQEGKLVAFPTETVYGLGADARNAEAIAGIFEAKGRPSSNPLIVHIADISSIDSVADLTPELEEKILLASRFFPGPLSIVLPKKSSIPDEVSGGRATVAVRIPSHPVAQALLKAAAIPVAAPSANRSDYVSPTTAQHVQDCLGESVDLILDGGSCPLGIESTVLSLLTDPPTILRPGGVTREELTGAFGVVHSLQSAENCQDSPGMLAKHYSPQSPVRFFDEVTPSHYPSRVGLLRFHEGFLADTDESFAAVTTLSADRSLESAASRLYAALRELDAEDLDLILIERCSETGIGVAIMDRLTRATGS